MKRNLLLSVFFVIITSIAFAQFDATQILAYLPFEGNLSEASGKAVTFAESTNAAVTGTLTYEEGKFGQAASFDFRPIVSTGLGFQANGDFSITAWILMKELPSVINAGQTWIHQKDVADEAPGRIHLEVLKGDYIGSFTSGLRLDNTVVDGEVVSPVLIEKDVWYHVANVQDITEGTRKLYVNGVLVKTLVYSEQEEAKQVPEINNGEFVIAGAKNETGAPAIKQGSKLDDLLISKQVLSADLITSIMNNGVQSLIGGGTRVEETYNNKVKPYFLGGVLYLNNLNAQTVSNLEVFNMSGARVFTTSENATSFNLELKNGIYVVKVKTTNGFVSTSKISIF